MKLGMMQYMKNKKLPKTPTELVGIPTENTLKLEWA